MMGRVVARVHKIFDFAPKGLWVIILSGCYCKNLRPIDFAVTDEEGLESVLEVPVLSISLWSTHVLRSDV